MAIESHTASGRPSASRSSSSTSTGTLPVGAMPESVRLNGEPSARSSLRRTVSNAMPACRSAIQGRSDQDE